MTMSTARLNELRTFDPTDATAQQTTDVIQELTAEIQRLTKENAELQKDSDFLNRLQAAGVDNWDGYHYGFGDEEDEDE